MNTKLLQQALDALQNSCDFIFKDVTKSHLRHQAIAALEAALAQPTASRYGSKDMQDLILENLAQPEQPAAIRQEGDA